MEPGWLWSCFATVSAKGKGKRLDVVGWNNVLENGSGIWKQRKRSCSLKKFMSSNLDDCICKLDKSFVNSRIAALDQVPTTLMWEDLTQSLCLRDLQALV